MKMIETIAKENGYKPFSRLVKRAANELGLRFEIKPNAENKNRKWIDAADEAKLVAALVTR